MEKLQEFRNKARELADIENIIAENISEKRTLGINMRFKTSKEDGWKMIIAAVIMTAGFVVMNATNMKGYISFIAGAVFFMGLFGLYVALGDFRFKKEIEKSVNRNKSFIATKEAERKKITDDLIALQKADVSLPQECWWNTEVDPENTVIRLPPTYKIGGDFEMGFFNELFIHDKGGKLYLEDFTSFAVLCDAKRLHGVMDSCGVIYQNDELIKNSGCFKSMPLYSASLEEIGEISSNTEIIVNDKEAQMSKYRDKLDLSEIFLNYITDEGAVTNLEAAALGNRTWEEYIHESSMRNWNERNYYKELMKQPDSYEETTYRKNYNGLWECKFVTCAYAFVSAEKETIGQIALIAVPKKTLPVLKLIFRADQKTTPSNGYLTDYGTSKAIEFGKDADPDYKEIVDYVFSPKMKSLLGLKSRDILAPRPSNLSDFEWSYLVWRDHQ